MADEQTQNDLPATELLRAQHEAVATMLEQLPDATGQQRSDLFDRLRVTLAIHETAEEIVVHPEARHIGETGRHIVEARLKEEAQAKHLLAELEKIGPDGGGFDELFTSFRVAVLHHADAEETEVFPLLEENLDRRKLIEMGDAILFAEALAPTHPHRHGPESALGNLLIGPFVALVDQVRDRLKEHGKTARSAG